MWEKIIIENQVTNYSVSSDGQIRNDVRNTLLKQQTDYGYKTVIIRINKKPKKFRVHRLVALMFIPNEENKPYVNHIDGNRSNNNVSNLEWCTPQENTIHAVATGLMPPSVVRAIVQYNSDGEKIQEYNSIVEAARAINGDGAKITLCCQQKRVSHKNFQWRYKEEAPESLSKITPNPQGAKAVAQIDPKTQEVIAIYPTMHAAADAVKGTQSAISHVIKGDKQTKTHKGYAWKLVEEIVQ